MILDRLSIRLPWIDPSMMPNRKNGMHWGSVVKIKDKARQDAAYATHEALGRHTIILDERIALRVTFAAPDRIRRDVDNMLAAIKPQIDGIAKALNVNDYRFCPITLDRGIDSEGLGFIIVEVIA